MALDTDTVLWAVRGLHDPQDGGVRADDVARFMAKDATLSDDYSKDEVAVILESLVAEGALTHVSTTSAEESDENPSSHDATLYRFPSGLESLVPDDRTVAGIAEHNGWDHWLGRGADQPRDFLLESLAEDAAVGVEVKTSTADEAEAEASQRVRVDELESERDALLAERDSWRRRAESADEEVSRSRGEGDQLERERDALLAERDSWRRRAESADERVSRARGEGDELRKRVRELENRLGRERVLASERLETARRAAVGLARALEDLERLEPSAQGSRAPAHAIRHKKTLRGNWLQ